MLTAEIVHELRKPFVAEQIKWKIQTNPRDDGDGYAVVVAYIDARDVAERLDLATGGDWSNDYTLPQVKAGSFAVLECRLTVCGVTRCDVGAVPVETNADATKDLYSDALKRAAVQFGVASHVYRFPNVKAKAEKFGKSFYLSFRAKDELLALTRHLIDGTPPPKYTEIKVTGDSFGAGGSPPSPSLPPLTLTGAAGSIKQWEHEGSARLAFRLGDVLILAQNGLAEQWHDIADGEPVEVVGTWAEHPKQGRYLAPQTIRRQSAPVGKRRSIEEATLPL